MIRIAAFVMAGVVAAAAQAPTYRTRADLVRIDVLAERGGRPIAGLTADDFIVEDAGVRQKVMLLPAAETVSVSTVLDVSGSVSPEQLGHAAAAVQTLIKGLRGGDHHELYAFAGAVRLVPIAATASVADIARALHSSGGPHTALFDALQVAVLRGARVEGPKLALIVTDGRDNVSWLGASAIVDTAVRHETALHVLAIRQHTPGHIAVSPFGRDAGIRLLNLIANRTGGRVSDATWSADLVSRLEALLREYRQRYILAFTPEGVARGDGWHPLKVTLRRGRGTVHARDGYWSDRREP